VTSGGQAELGRALGGYVNVVTKSGTNAARGDLYGYFRDDSLNAANALLGSKLPMNQKQYGGRLGGPIVPNHTFFFANVELLHALSSSPVTRTVYTAAARNGQFRYVTSPNGALKNGNAASPVTSGMLVRFDATTGQPHAIASYNIAQMIPSMLV
jgi:hypothetical protein